MKKKSILFALALLVCFNAFAYDIDVIITKTREQIQCIIISQDGEYIRYNSSNPDDKQIYKIAKSDVDKVYVHNAEPEKVATVDNSKPVQQAVAKESVKESPKEENTTIQNEPVVQSSAPKDNINESAKEEIRLARVNTHNGVYVFNDCEPVSDYEVIGEFCFENLTDSEREKAGPQYQGLRDAFVKTAKMVNTQAEGIILTLVNGGVDKAYIIKFKDASADHAIARVQRYRGVYVFCDCEPLSNYKYLGNIKGKFTINPQYTVLRDDMLKKSLGKYSNTNGVILHLVTGGNDTAEAIEL